MHLPKIVSLHAALLAIAMAAAAGAQASPSETPAGTGSSAGSPSEGPSAPAAAPAVTARAEIQWLEWGPEAFRRAALREKPILLNIIVSWSRQCRAMEAVWGDPGVSALVNEAFVPVRVDADARPDVYARYQSATWPAVTLLLPNGIPFYTAMQQGAAPTRVTLGQMPADRLRRILEETVALFSSRRSRPALKRTVEEGRKAEGESLPAAAELDSSLPPKILESLRSNFDMLHGGWTKAPKFPRRGPIEFCLASWSAGGDPRALEVAERAMQAVIRSPLYDAVGGGVHRIAAREDWSEPEYEKLLDRNVEVLEALLSTYLVTQKQEYADRAAEIVRFLDSTLRRRGGGYYAGQFSDPSSPDGGAWYRAAEAERKRLTPPAVSTLVPVAWSARAAAAQLRAAYVLQHPEWVAPARETLDWLVSSAWDRGRGAVHAIDGERKILSAWLEDQVLFAEAMLQAYQFSGNKRWLSAARDTASFAVSNLFDRQAGLFADLIPNPSDPAVPMRRALHPYEWNCRMARVLTHLFRLSPQDKALREGARGVLGRLGAGSSGPAGAWYALALTEYQEGPLWGWVVGSAAISGYDAMLSAVHRVPVLWKLVVTLDPADGTDAKSMVQLGFVRARPPAVYFTKGTRTSMAAELTSDVPSVYRALVDAARKERP